MTDSSATKDPASQADVTAGERGVVCDHENWTKQTVYRDAACQRCGTPREFVFRGQFRKAYEARFSEDFDGRISRMIFNGHGEVATMLSFMATYLDNLTPAEPSQP